MAILLLDNFDSFTYNLAHYIEQCGVPCRVVRNNAGLSAIKRLDFAAIVLSPGPETPDKAGCMMEMIDRYHTQKPILGICLGHQGVGQYFGCRLVKAPRPKHGKITPVILNDRDGLFSKLPGKINVVQYNSLLLEDIEGTGLRTIATDAAGHIMAIRHTRLPVWGLQFHPEAALTEHGAQIIKNWLDLAGINN